MRVLFYGMHSYDCANFEKALAGYPDIQGEFARADLNPMTAALASGFDAVCAFVNADVGGQTLGVLYALGIRLVLMRCAGFDAVDVAAAKRLGMTVTRVPAYSPEAIAEHAMALALAANRRVHKGYNRVRENNFSLTGLVGSTFHGKAAGIIGTGKIGAALCRICKGFGMTVLGSDPYPNQALVEEGVIDEYVSFDEVVERADLISLHAFLNEESYHMIDARAISRMRDGVVLVNTGRGALVDTDALVEGILSGKIGAAGIDVYEQEGPNVYRDRGGEVFDSVPARLCTFPNVVVTSHQAFFTHEALDAIAQCTLYNARAFETGGDLVPGSVVYMPGKE